MDSEDDDPHKESEGLEGPARCRWLWRSVGYSSRVVAARMTLDQVKVEDIDTNVAVLKAGTVVSFV